MVLAAALGVPRAQAQVPAGSQGGGGISVPPNCTVTFTEAGPAGPDRVLLSGYVDILCGDFRIQADSVLYDMKTKQGSAEGVVVLDWDGNRITGSRMEFDLATQTGTMSEASGWIEPEAILKAKRIQKLDEDHVLLESGTFTSCTQPIPYWSFRIGRGLFHLDHYAHLRHVRMNIGRVPVFYLPWMLWPIKGDRATGFLFPQWGTSRKYGFFLSEAFFWPFARNADVTVYGDYYKSGGAAGGLEVNWLPSERGRARLTGYYLDDTRRDERRYVGRLQLLQPVGGGWKLSADLNEVSDPQYYQDFERTLAAAATSFVLSTANLIRNGEDTSFNVKAQRREQFFITSGFTSTQVDREVPQEVDEVLPELEMRGRSRRLPGSPLYFSYESSADYFRLARRSQTVSFETAPNELTETQVRAWTDWGRLDLAPRFMLPLHPAPWLSVETSVLLRETYYTSRTIETITRTRIKDADTGDLLDEQSVTSSEGKGSVNRHYYELEADFIGPRFYHVYASSSAFSSTYKHVIEPRLTYSYIPTIAEQDRVPIFDQERDLAAGERNDVSVALLNRLFAKRPARTGPPPDETSREGSDTAGTLPWSSFPTPVETPPPAPPAPVSSETVEPMKESPSTRPPAAGPPAGAAGAPAAESPESNPVEILSVEVSQRYSFEHPLSVRFRTETICSNGAPPPCTGDTEPVTILIPESTRSYSPLSFALHFNPTLSVSVDLRSDYDLANTGFSSNALSGWYRWKTGYFNGTYFRSSLAGLLTQSSQIHVGAGNFLFNRKLTLDGDLGYDLHGSALLDWRGRLGYYTQCCGFIVEYLDRDFEENRRREVRFVIDLKGIGKFLDPNVNITK